MRAGRYGVRSSFQSDLAHFNRAEETRGLEAAIQKQLGLNASNPTMRFQHLLKSIELYEAAWKAPDGSFGTGIHVG